jgi:DNA-binding CsgD family transcriptional regulator
MKNTALLAHIRQLCCLGLGGRAIMPALLKAARELVPSDSAEFFWVDARGEMTNHYAEQMLPADVMQSYFRRAETEAEHPFFASFKTRAAQPDPVTTMTVTDAFKRTDLCRSVMQHLGAEHALYCVIRERDRPLGQLSLYRGKKRAPFGAGERAAIAAIAGYIAHGLDDSFGAGKYTAVDPSYRDTDHQAMLTLERDGTLRHCSSAARRLLLYVTLDSVNRGTVAQQDAAIGGLMRELADQLTAVFIEREDIAVAPPAMVVTNRWGRFVLRAYCLTDDVHAPDALIGVQIRRQEPMVLRLSQAMQRLSLSPQQKEVGLLLAQGKSNPEIAGALGVSLNTANYHVKQLFAKLDTHERTEVAPKLLGMSDGTMHSRVSQQPGAHGQTT